MRYLKLLLIILFFSNCKAQNKELLIEQKLDTGLSVENEVFASFTEKVNGKAQWKKGYNYLDSIALYQITYMSDGLTIHGFIAKPQKAGKYPAVIFNRGGNREFGALNTLRAAMLLGRVARAGYIVIASQYRGNGGSEGQEEFGGSEVNDILILPKVLEEVEGADTDHVGMYGWSRGGMMTYIALTKTDRIKAAVVGGAVSDNFETIRDRPDMETYVLAELIPDYETNKEAELTKRSAIKWADKLPKNVPILMLHGNADWRVKPEQSLRMALEFEKYRVPYRLIMFEGADHGISEHRPEVNEQVIRWFDRFLKKGEDLPNMEYHGR